MNEDIEKLDRDKFSKCMIEATHEKELPNSFMIKLFDGEFVQTNAEYLQKHVVYALCKVFGYETKQCNLKYDGDDNKEKVKPKRMENEKQHYGKK